MTFEDILTTGILLAYSFGTVGVFLGTLAMRPRMSMLANWTTLGGFVLHTLAVLYVLGNALFSKSASELDTGFYMQLLAWCLLFLYLCAWRWLKQPFLSLTAAPLALILFVLSFRLAHTQPALPDNWRLLFVGLHVVSLFLSIGLLALASGAGILFIHLEKKIKAKTPISGVERELPALGTYDKVNSLAVAVGFPLYTLGLMSGFIWMPLLHGARQPKVLVSLVIWFLFAVFFYQRLGRGLRGRKTAFLAIWIFLISAASLGMDHLLTHHSQLLMP